ncbi:MAG: hypothetical protein UW70_C0093G0005 [Candidatus Peregrinibacteria bacterium GW2011_GWA2_44_7]|nr:MAG: hypothetical protein UW70_C0093G0005 [Candidatus Peregrinibacteria bacterium GW2011_GWA2_44_7]
MSKLPYHYTIIDISEGNEIGFKAVIPKFPKLHIMADSLSQLHDIVKKTIFTEIILYKKKRIPIPKPDLQKYSGRFVLRVRPEVHEKLAQLSEAKGTSLNHYLNRLIEDQIMS